MGCKGELQASGYVALRGGTQPGDEPALILRKGIHTPVGTDLTQEARAGVALSASAGDENLAGLGVTITEL